MDFLRFLWEYPGALAGIWLGLVNLILFFLMGLDKGLAKAGARRIPEATLFLFALIGGALGGLIGMFVFHHKTRHRTFTIGFPLILLLHLVLLFLLLR